MKYLALAIALSFPWPAFSAKGDSDHVNGSAAILAASYHTLKKHSRYPLAWSVGIAFAAGLSKEISDPFFSRSDLEQNSIGIGMRLIPIAVWDF